jgi:hypothetical protein
MTDSQGGLSLPGHLSAGAMSHQNSPRGRGKSWPGKLSTAGFTVYNNEAEAEAPAQKVVEERAA